MNPIAREECDSPREMRDTDKEKKSLGVRYGKSVGLCVMEGVRANGGIGVGRNTRDGSPNSGREILK